MDLDPNVLAQLGSVPAWGSFFILVGWVIRTWPHWKEKINEARKIQLDADGERLAQAFARIRVLEEAQSADRREFNEAMSSERKRCDGELDEIRTEMRERLTAAEDENRGLKSMIRQNSSSTAEMVTRPDAVAESNAQRKKRRDRA